MKNKAPYLFFLSSFGAIAFAPTCHFIAHAQVISDGTLSTTVTSPDNQNFVIENGDRNGNNLFHSFDTFSIPTNGSAVFNNPTDIETIFSRVTGANVSDIDGLIQANGTADLFLLNPNGIIFGADAQLDIGGSFISTTADSVLFQDNTVFSATNPQETTLLSVSTPIGLQFGTVPGPIQANGPGHDSGFQFFFGFGGIKRANRLAGLEVPSAHTLALVGGDIDLSGAGLTAIGGRIELGSVAAPSTVSLTPTSDGFTLGYDEVTNFGDIQLTRAASLEASGEGGGNIQLRGRQISLAESSVVLADTLGMNNGGEIVIEASESIKLVGTDFINTPTGIFSNVALEQSGNAGRISVDTPKLTLTEASMISSGTFGMGNGNTITINTDTLSLLNGGQITTETNGPGNAGNLIVKASESIEARGFMGIASFPSGLFSEVRPDATGNGGIISVETGSLQLLEGAQISAQTEGNGNGGDLFIRANDVEISDAIRISFDTDLVDDFFQASGLTVGAFFKATTGNAGNLVLIADRLRIAEGGQISAGAQGTGAAGTVALDVASIEVTGTSNLIVVAPAFGDIVEAATEDSSLLSSITAFASTDAAAAGAINITAENVTVQNGAEISVSSQGGGDTGNLTITTDTLLLDTGAQLQAEANGGSQGNIDVTANDILLLRRGGAITTNATEASTGGNININTPVIFALPIENSDIVANAVDGDGGNIQITADGIFGLQFRPELTPLSDITASSEFGVNGVVQLDTPELDPSQGLIELPSELIDPSNQISTSCLVAADNSLTVSGRSGLPDSPDTPSSSAVWEDWRPLETEVGLATVSMPVETVALAEATDVVVTANGQVQFVAPTNARSEPPIAHTNVSCSSRENV